MKTNYSKFMTRLYKEKEYKAYNFLRKAMLLDDKQLKEAFNKVDLYTQPSWKGVLGNLLWDSRHEGVNSYEKLCHNEAALFLVVKAHLLPASYIC